MPNSASVPFRPAPAGFDRLAWCYDALAALVFGPALRRAQRAALVGLPPGAPHVLVLGGGTGWVLTEILRRRPQATVLYLEASAAMLARARQRLHRRARSHATQVEFRHGTQADLRPAEQFACVVTFFVLDCLPASELPLAVRQLLAARQPGAPWLLADFRPPRTWWQRGLLRLMLAFFRATAGLPVRQVADFEALLAAQGLRPQVRQTFFGGWVAGAAWQDAAAPAVRAG